MKNRIRLLGSRFAAISLMWLVSAPLALAQAGAREGTTQPQHAQTSNQQEPLVAPVNPVMAERVGVDPNQILRLSLHDTILMALEHNNTIQVERTNILASEQGLKAAQGAYDIALGANISAETATNPSNSIRGVDRDGDGLPDDANGDGVIDSTELAQNTRRTIGAQITVQQFIPFGGGSWRFQLDASRFKPDTTVISFGGITLAGGGFAYLPAYNSQVTFEYQQPILRNFRVDRQRQQIRLAKKALDLSDSQFRQRVIDIITQVQQAYWDLVFAIRAVEIQQEALNLARTNLENNRKQVEAGTLAPIELAQSEAQVEQNRQNLTAAIGTVTLQENILKMLILGDPNASEWKANVAPTESIDHLPTAVDFESALRLAQANRPELEQLHLQKERNAIDIKYYANQTLPEVNIFGRYIMTGFAGRPQAVVDARTGDPLPTVPQFSGGVGTSLKTAFSNDFSTYSFGLQFNFPLRNRTAEGLLGQAKATTRSLDFQEQQLLQSISVEVRNALQRVETARRNIEAARAARIARETQFEGEQKKFEAGLSTTFFVLQFQNFLSEARLTELQALVAYNKAIADLQRVMSTTLSAHNVEISPRLPEK
ncbi:MAG: TolC family protein [Acidobacteria bacterium]|nr:TolC family protein [Acidobacteriota bacterium]